MGDPICSIPGCERVVKVKARGWCWTHYKRWQRHADATTPSRYDKDALTRFFENVDIGDCWEWTSARSNDYGYFAPPGHRQARGAHRWLYETLVGPVPIDLELDHLCRNPPCVNPDHLQPVPPRINNLRGFSFAARNARKTHCPQGHPYDELNTKLTVSGGRSCRACWNTWRRAHRQKRREAGLSSQ